MFHPLNERRKHSRLGQMTPSFMPSSATVLAPSQLRKRADSIALRGAKWRDALLFLVESRAICLALPCWRTLVNSKCHLARFLCRMRLGRFFLDHLYFELSILGAARREPSVRIRDYPHCPGALCALLAFALPACARARAHVEKLDQSVSCPTDRVDQVRCERREMSL